MKTLPPCVPGVADATAAALPPVMVRLSMATAAGGLAGVTAKTRLAVPPLVPVIVRRLP